MKSFDFSPFPKLHTQRLILRKFRHKDDKEIFELRSNDIVNRYSDRKKQQSIDESKAVIDKINGGINENKWINWAIVKKVEDVFMGSICLWNFSKNQNSGELGYELIPQYHSCGYMREALKKVLEYGFETLELSKICAFTHKQNENSIKLLKNAGFRHDKSKVLKEEPHLIAFSVKNNNLQKRNLL